MKRQLLLFVLLLLTIIPTSQPRAQVQVGGFCADYSTNFGQIWKIDTGTSGGVWSQSYYGSVSKQQRADAWIYSPIEDFSYDRVYFDISPALDGPDPLTATGFNTNPYVIELTLHAQDNSIVYQQTYSFPAPNTSTWIHPLITLPATKAAWINVKITQEPISPGVLAGTFTYMVRRLCGDSTLPTPSPTPTNTHIPPTVTVGPSFTPVPTTTPRPTNTATKTRTPVPTRTPSHTPTRTPTSPPGPTNTPTDTPSGPTNTPTDTPSGPTDTPEPTNTPGPTNTFEPPTEIPAPTEPAQSTLAEYDFNTPHPPDSQCTDPADPCHFWPDIRWPDPNLPTPTAAALLPSLTPLPSITPLVLATHGTPVIPVPGEIWQFATAVSNLPNYNTNPTINDANGTPVGVAQYFHDAGTSMGNGWATVKSVISSDLGPVGGLLLFIFAMIVLNVQLRIILFLYPIVKKIVEFVLDLATKVLQAIPFLFVLLFIICMAAAPNTVKALGPTATWTPVPSLTPTPTLRAVQPTATSKYKGLRPTPSPLPYATAAHFEGFDTVGASGNLADNIINEYRYFNHFGVMDMLGFVVLMLVCVWMLVRIQKRLTKDVQ